jgi:tetratricopeptide (TPR) repeat protein
MPRPLAFLSVLLIATSCFVPCFASSAPEQWVQVTSPHFKVITSSNDKQARHLLDQFERMRWMFQTLFPKSRVDPPIPIVVIAVKNRAAFQQFEPAAYLAKGQMNLAGLFLRTPDKNYVLLRLDGEGEHPYATVYHEYTHLQFSDAGDWMPLWLNEGFAEFIQNTEIRNKDVLIGEPSVDDILYLRQNTLLPLATLFKVDHQSPYYHDEQKGSVFYAESWVLTHYLEIGDKEKGTHRLTTYMQLVSQHQDPVVAAQTAFGDLKQLQQALETYVRAGDYKQFVLSSAAAPIDESSYKSSPLTNTQADAYRADFLVYVQRTQEAQSLLDAVLKADPNNGQALETKGYLAFREGDRAAARQWYEKAVKLDSQSYLAHYYFAIMSMGHADSSDPDSSNHAEVEGSLRDCIRLNSSFAPCYDQLAGYYSMRHEKLDEAHTLNLQAIQLDSGNLIFRMNAASVLMTMSRYADAAAVLHSAVSLAKNPGEVQMVQSRLKQIEQIQSLGAPESAMTTAPPTGVVEVQTTEKVVDIVAAPKHPNEPPTGPRHIAVGVIYGVECNYPAVIDFEVQTTAKPVSVYSNNYFKIDLTASNFTPSGSMNPCKDLDGMKAKVQYAESSDKTVDGQVISIELRK